MLGRRTKLLPPSFFSASAVDDNNNESKIRIDSIGAHFSDDCDWVPLGFDSSINKETVSEKRADNSSSHNIDSNSEDPFQLTLANGQISSNPHSCSLRQLLVETGRKRCSPYPPLVSPLRNETTLKSCEKYVRLTDNDLSNVSYAPMRLSSDDDSDDEVMRSMAENREDSSSGCKSSVVNDMTSKDCAKGKIEYSLAAPTPDEAAAAVSSLECVADAKVAAPTTPSRDPAAGESREDFVVRISKQLSWILRHGALRVGLKIEDDGFLDVESILKVRIEGFVGQILVRV